MKKNILSIMGLVGLVILVVAIFQFKKGNQSVERPPQEGIDQERSTVQQELPKSTHPSGEQGAEQAASEVEPSQIKVKEITPSQIELGGKERPLTDNEMEQLEAYYERVEKDWEQKVRTAFKNYGLSENVYKEYEKMRENYEEAKMDAFQEFHNKMIEKYGDNYEYNPSDEQDAFSAKVNRQFQDQLRQKLGEQNYAQYSEMREAYNEKLRKEQNPELGIMVMDF